MRIRTILAVLAVLAITAWAVVQLPVSTMTANHSTRGTVAVSPSQAKAVSVAVAAEPSGPTATVDNGPQRYIVVLKDGKDPATVVKRHAFTPRVTYKHALNGFAGELPEALRKRLAADPDVAYIENDSTLHTCQQTVPVGVMRIGTLFNSTAAIGAHQNVNVGIAILDTGIDPSHPDLNVVGGWNFITNTSSFNDDEGHGTHCAGIAAAIDNDIGVVGVAPGARLWALKFINSNEIGYNSDAIAALDWVLSPSGSDISVVNMSFGMVGPDPGLQTAIQNTVAAGVVCVAAAGNNGQDVYGPDGTYGSNDNFTPAAFPEVCCVAAMVDLDGLPGGLCPPNNPNYPDDTLAMFSNYSLEVTPLKAALGVVSPGGAIDLAAPGYWLYSTYPVSMGSYTHMSGTSMAAPHVTGAVALYIAANGRPRNAAGVAAIRQCLINQAVPQSQWGPADVGNPGLPLGLVNVGQCALNTSVFPFGTGTVTTTPSQATYAYGGMLAISATPALGYTFSGWSVLNGTVSNATAMTTSLSIIGNCVLSAIFTPGEYTLAASATPSGGGSVAVSPSQATYTYDDALTISATTNPGYTFAGWTVSGGSLVNPTILTTSMNIAGDCTLTASFTQQQYTLTAAASPWPGGAVVVSPSQATYTYGNVVTISETATPGYTFTGWTVTGGGSVSNSPAAIASLTITGYYCNLTANYTHNTFSGTETDVGGSITLSSSGPYSYGQVVTATEAAGQGYIFAGWNVTGPSTVSSSDSAAVTTSLTVYGSFTLTASFAAIPYTLTVGAVPAVGGTVAVTPSQATYFYGDVVTISETTNPGATFTMWNVAGGTLSSASGSLTLTIHGNCTLTAHYTVSSFSGTDAATGGTITLSSTGPYYYDTEVTATAAANPLYRFSYWTASGCSLSSSTALSTTLTVLGDWTLTANFVAAPTLTVSAALDNSWVYQNTAVTTQDRQCRVMTITVLQDSWPDDYFTVTVSQSGSGVVVPSLTFVGDPSMGIGDGFLTPTSSFILDGMTGYATLYLVGDRRQADGVTGTGSCTVTLQVTGNISQAANAVTVQVVLTVRPLGDINGDGAVTTADRVQLMKRFNGVPTPNQTAADFDLDGDGTVTTNDLAILNTVLNNFAVP